MIFHNPIISGYYPDPSICRVGEDYYLVTSTCEFFPGVPVFHSKDLIHWKQIGHCLTRKSQINLDKAKPSSGIYAPTIRYYNGIFYMITTNSSYKGNFFVTATDPAGEWSDPIWVEQKGIDPSLFFDDDGKVYYTSTSGEESTAGTDEKVGIVQAEINIKTGKLKTSLKYIWRGTGGRYPEGPHLYKINKMYYLMIAEGGTEYGHMVTIARSRTPWGIFEPCPSNPILTHRNRGLHEIQGTGHADLIKAHDSSWWMVFLAFRNTILFFHHLGRETFIAPVSWNSNGWPIVNVTGTVESEMNVNCLPKHPVENEPMRDDFDGLSLRLYWNFLRNPYPGSWDLTSRKGWLCLYGSEITLGDIDSPALIARRQQHFNCIIRTRMEFYPVNEGEEAGLTVFYNNEHHYEIAVSRMNGLNQVIVRKRIGDLSAVVVEEPFTEKSVILIVKADKHQYSFGYGRGDSDEEKFLCQGRTQFVSTEATIISFTGVYFGLYATGSGRQCSVPAYFDWFDYEIL